MYFTFFYHKPVQNHASHGKQSIVNSEGIIDTIAGFNTQAPDCESDDGAWRTGQFDVTGQAPPCGEHVEGNTHIRNTSIQLIHTLRT